MERVRGLLVDPVPVGPVELRVDASIGIATYPLDSRDAKGLLAAADAAMHAGKRSARASPSRRALLAACPRATRSTGPRGGCRCSSASGWRSSRRIRARRRAGRGRARRAAARVGRGRRQEPPAALRGRRRRPQPPADERALACSAARRARVGAAVARAARGEPRACSGTGRCSALDARRPRGSARTSSARSPTSTRRRADAARGRIARLGETLQDQRLVAGIGNMWMAESLWAPDLAVVRVGDVLETRCRGARDGAPADAGARSTGREPGSRCTAAPAGRARAAARSSARAGRATRTAPRTGAPLPRARPRT